MKILGIQDGHNASAALIDNGTLVTAVQEERLTRYKNQGGYPAKAVENVLKISGSSIDAIDFFVFPGLSGTGDEYITREDVLASYTKKVIDANFSKFLKEKRSRLKRLLRSKSKKQRRANNKWCKRIQNTVRYGVNSDIIERVEHHTCHAATAYYGQENRDDEILVLTSDAAGDGLCATVNIGKNGRINRLAKVEQSHSPAYLYAFLTFLTGFVPLEHEYKLMGLAPYSEGSPGAIEVCKYLENMFCFTSNNELGWERAEGVGDVFRIGLQLKKFTDYKRFDSIAGGLQLFIERFCCKWIKRVVEKTGIRKLALSGGLFMNVKLNKLIMELDEVESLFVFPSCGDETTSIGAAWAVYAEKMHAKGKPINISPLDNFYLGGDIYDNDVEETVRNYNFKSKVNIKHSEDIEKDCAELISKGHIVARCKGRMEFGARALGNRSILARADNWDVIKIINKMIKKRDFWMPFAPSMLDEYSSDYIENPKNIRSPYMILAFNSKEKKINKMTAGIHPYDLSCRPQIVEKTLNPDYHKLISYFKDLTGEAAILNTSFNLHGFPLVYQPADALEVFENSGLKYLALGNFMLEKNK